ncbi:MAG TPA: peptide chain release factor N(5)-glutamine methyltransferase [Acidobacteriota bacterium]|nr:peptide chain release factor N(5)-glutamine methyltransferase [Acidobacteriota bacterium]
MDMEGTLCNDLPSQPCLRNMLRHGIETLVAGGIQSARIDAEVLLADAVAMTREQIVVGAELPISSEQLCRFDTLLQRRVQREPVAYITERQEFWSLEFRVTPEVLIPRPETERLIEIALSLAKDLPADKPQRFADIGTGSGIIAVSLARELVTARVLATDISTGALTIARENARLNGVADRITFLAGNMFAALATGAEEFDLIVSNPPYIRRDEIATLEPEINRWEPRRALDGGADGMDFYRCIAAQTWQFLSPHGAVMVEIGAAMGCQVLAIFNQAGFYRDVTVMPDYAGRERVVIARNAARRLSSK